ncbi:PTS sugar transporter subunit IIA [Bifidobacterium sp.]|uniref:PTS sugar transporter subunit IIA n=1 Tax=Bifidobacterium sp. TaxID=41200 RepID=UPI0039E80263
MNVQVFWNMQLASYSRETFLNESVAMLDRHGDIVDRAEVVQSLKDREIHGNTLLSETLALPHSQSGGVRTLVMAFFKTMRPIYDWQPGCGVDRFLCIMLPRQVNAVETNALKALFGIIADDRVMQILSTGSETAVNSQFSNK